MKPKTENRQPETTLEDLDRAILNEIQSNFPLVPRPYAEMGKRVGPAKVKFWDGSGICTRPALSGASGLISPPGKLGYTSTLCAARVPPQNLEHFAEVVNRYPGRHP